MKLSAIILAAGEGKRIGVPKAILRIKDEFLADIQFELLSSLRIEDIKIVIGAKASEIKRLLKNRRAVVINEKYSDGQFSSLVCGIKAIADADGLIILPVDTYPLEKDVVSWLISEFEREFDATIPVYMGRRGHPIILSNTFARGLLNYNIRESRLDYILRKSNTKLVEVNTPTILNNVNTTSDIR
ncbi:MAG: nucleotidyltransferase family protein [Myxococcota bacterium]